jgi:hypothetical protein
VVIDMDTTEKHVSSWVPFLWESACRFDMDTDWTAVAAAMYGALQACNQVDASSDYEAYSFLASIARQRRLESIVYKYRGAA